MFILAKSHKEFLNPYAALPNGIPSHDTYRRVISLLNPDVLRRCLNDYGKDITGLPAEKQISPDGKKLRGVSPTSRGNTGLYIVNTRVSENRLCVGQKNVEDRSNEITVIPSLIDEPDITDAVVCIVTFREDHCRTRKDNAPENLSTPEKTCLATYQRTTQ
ncbi:MAG: ISAs1 family transposase [Tannerella sp.]|jgi:hypothetical protein|nr:ISAs1 family transposase [Tannerella sp.]